MRTEPAYFGSDGRLLGILDAPSDREAVAGVVICQPIGHEYLTCHRGCRQLALRLVERGFAVFRFDYRGCGDSLGDGSDANWEAWVEDTESAISHLRNRCATVAAIGLRLGANLVAAAGSPDSGSDENLDRVVFWEPVLSGREYLAGLKERHEELVDRYPSRRIDGDAEILGFTFAPSTLSTIEELELVPERVTADRGVLFLTGSRTLGRQVAERGPQLGDGVEHRQVEEPDSWVEKPAIVPAAGIAAIADWLSESGS